METLKKILNLDKRTYLIKFAWKATENKFLFQSGHDLMHLLKNKDNNGIEYIKEYDAVKDKFIRISKKDLLTAFSWETEAILYLEKALLF